jgi:hypothetical protein
MSFLHGLAAEYLVMSDLAAKGYSPAKAAAHLPYDLLVDVDGQMLRVQVKGSAEMAVSEAAAYMRFKISDGRGKPYPPNSFELLALVDLSTRTIAYVKYTNQKSLQFQPSYAALTRSDSRHMHELTLEKALKDICASEAS